MKKVYSVWLFALTLATPACVLAGEAGGLPAERAAREAADANLQSQIDAIELLPGPQGPAGPPGESAPTFVYVGGSSGTTLPNIGHIGLSRLCADTYGPDARMCDTKELIETTSPPESDGNQWINPSLTGAVVNVGGVDMVVDYSGIRREPEKLVCGSTSVNSGPWSVGSSDNRGLVYVTSLGNIVVAGCNGVRPVACCAPGG